MTTGYAPLDENFPEDMEEMLATRTGDALEKATILKTGTTPGGYQTSKQAPNSLRGYIGGKRATPEQIREHGIKAMGE